MSNISCLNGANCGDIPSSFSIKPRTVPIEGMYNFDDSVFMQRFFWYFVVPILAILGLVLLISIVWAIVGCILKCVKRKGTTNVKDNQSCPGYVPHVPTNSLPRCSFVPVVAPPSPFGSFNAAYV